MWKYRMGLLAAFLLWMFPAERAAAADYQKTVYNSPYVSFSPDGQAWTINAGDRNIRWYRKGETVSTGITSSLRPPGEGEHYYSVRASGQAPVGRWVVEHEAGQCVHEVYPPRYHGLNYGRQICRARHYSGWIAYCADCGDRLSNIFVYMSREAAETVQYIPLETDYYSLCPFCDNLEQGSMFRHMCKAVSANMYRVVYDANFPEAGENGKGYMAYSLHMYNDTEEYEGIQLTPVKELTQNGYSCTGYRFAGWNREPDGSGEGYGDRDRILNLTSENWNGLSGQEAKGTVTLYAQWKPVASTLRIDPAGGTYQGKSGITGITKRHGETYKPDASLLDPPAGYRVTFQTNGGSPAEPAAAAAVFREWAADQPFSGSFQNGIYRYTAPEGSSDTLRAVYDAGSIVLPQTAREGWSFGGWYYDAEFRIPAGGAGETFTPGGNLTLYAQWADLALTAADNYSAYGGSGAVDLLWQMRDGKEKAYLLYQSPDGEEWTKIGAADDIGSETSVHLELQRTGREENYKIPYAGIYTLILSGAQGGSYGDCRGGKGGTLELKLWLEKGEVLTFRVGGSDGYGGGGKGSVYGGGGGCTVVSSDKKGVIAVAGGGGGASESGSGGDGGSAAFLTDRELCGEDGMAGGGGGYRGGAAGEYILHSHTAACYREISGTVSAGPGFYGAHTSWHSNIYLEGVTATNMKAGVGGHSNGSNPSIGLRAGNASAYLETPYAGRLTFSAAGGSSEWDAWGVGAENIATTVTVFFIHADGRVTSETVFPEGLSHSTVTGTNVWYAAGGYEAVRPVSIHRFSGLQFSGTIETMPHASCENPPGSFHGIHAAYNMSGTFSFDVEEDVKGIYIEAARSTATAGEGCWMSIGVENVSYQYSGRMVMCGYEEGEVESALPAYGGSSYVNPEVVYSYSLSAGDREGDGRALLDTVQGGFVEELELKNVKAKDLAAPDTVREASVEMRLAAGGCISVSWGQPKDNGTTYYHRAEAYIKGMTSPLAVSNITQNTLVSGVAGYYYVIDGNRGSLADGRGSYTAGRSVELAPGEAGCYLHLAAVDTAGNIGGTIHVKIDGESVPWKIGTRQLRIRDGENVSAADPKTCYVRCDGVTPFLLEHGTYMEGPATKDNLPVYSIFELSSGGQNVFHMPSEADFPEAVYSTEGAPILARYPFSAARRSHQGRVLDLEQMFTLGPEAHGQRIEVIPRAGAVYLKRGIRTTYYSEPEEDKGNGITLIGDGEGPVVSGLEVLAEGQFIDRGEESVRLCITASDELSGVAEFYLEVTNRDNHGTKIFYPEGNRIELEITKEEALFTGEFTVTAYARDHVGNETRLSRSVTEFALEARIERILEPHDPVFKGGESGILYITVYGYADRAEAEFPPELAGEDGSRSGMVFDYSDMQIYMQESKVQFMVPLYIPAGREYTLKVRAFRGDNSLECEPTLKVTAEGGNVLSEFHTRLR